MKLKLLVIPILAMMLAVAASANRTRAQEATPQAVLISASPTGPTAGTLLTGGLLSPRGLKVGPDGMLYVAEAGTGGDTTITIEGTDSKVGTTGRISKIDPATGTRTTVIDGRPSHVGPEGDSVGPADVAFIGTQLYYVQTHGGDAYGFPSTPTGIYKVTGSTATLVADIGAFNIANPVTPLVDGTQQDIEPGGNPYSMMVIDGAFYVVDGNQNQVMKVTTAGAITRIVDFPTHNVSTGIAGTSGGPLFVSALGVFPFAAEDGIVYQVGNPTGNLTQIASGYSSLTDVEIGPGGQLYALSFGDQNTVPDAPPWTFNSGKILKVNASGGTMSVVVDGFTFTTGLIFVGDTAYVSNGGISIPGLVDGQIWAIPNFSSVTPPAAVPTAAPTAPPAATATPTGGPSGAIIPPSTGTGGQASGSGGGSLTMLLVLGIAGAIIVGAGTRMIWKRDA